MTPELVAQHHCQTGEAPLWHPTEQRLYWSDIPAGKLYWFDPVTDRSELCYHDRPVGAFTIQSDGHLLLFRDKGNVVTFRGGQVRDTVIDAIPELAETRFNDVIADPEGRVFAGTMSHGPAGTHNGRLYRMDRDGSYHLLSEGHGTPNGMGFSPDGRTMYFADSRLATLYAFDYDRATGDITNRRVVYATPKDRWEELGRGDGLTVDAGGNLWTGRYGGGQIIVYSPNGELLRRIPMPTKDITSLTFAHDDLDTVYATSAGGDDTASDSPAGGLFRLTPGVKGMPEFESRVQLKV